MAEEVLIYHSAMVKLLLFVLAADLVLPYLFRKNREREIRMTRISFFTYSATLAMAAFSGAVLFVLMKSDWNIGNILMIFLFVFLAGTEIARSRKLVGAWREGESASAYSWPYVLAEIVATGSMILYMMIGKQNAVSL
jgi:uncharacterized membrane protein